MLNNLIIMGLDGIIGSGMAGAEADTGKTQEELFDLLQKAHDRMNAAGREALTDFGFDFKSEGDVWTGTGAGLLSLLYLLHAKSTVAHFEQYPPEVIDLNPGTTTPDAIN